MTQGASEPGVAIAARRLAFLSQLAWLGRSLDLLNSRDTNRVALQGATHLHIGGARRAKPNSPRLGMIPRHSRRATARPVACHKLSHVVAQPCGTVAAVRAPILLSTRRCNIQHQNLVASPLHDGNQFTEFMNKVLPLQTDRSADPCPRSSCNASQLEVSLKGAHKVAAGSAAA